MTVELIVPPKDDQKKLAEVGQEIVEAASYLGEPVGVEGFLAAWVSHVKVAVKRNDKGRIEALAMFVGGPRWIDSKTAVHVLRIDGPRTELIEFIKTIAIGMNASALYVEERELVESTDEYLKYAITCYKL